MSSSDAMSDWKTAVVELINPRVLVGICLATIGGAISHFACALMRYAHLKNAEKQIEYQKIYIMDPRWWICLGFYLIGLLFSFVSLYLIRMMVVVTLTSVGVWIGLQYTTWYSGNRMKHRDYTSYAVIVAGNLLLLLVGLKANTRESAKSLSEVFDLTLNFSNNPKIMIAYLMAIIAPIGLVVIHQFEYFKRLFVPAAFTCLTLLLSMVNAKIFTGGWSVLFALIPLAIHVHMLQTPLCQYLYYSWLACSQVMTTIFGLIYSQVFFKEFPGVVQTIFIIIAVLMQLGGHVGLLYERAPKTSFVPERTNHHYTRFNEINYAFDSDEGSLELHALDSDSDEDTDRSQQQHPPVVVGKSEDLESSTVPPPPSDLSANP